MKIKVQRLENYPKEWELPSPAHPGDVGYDLRNAGPNVAIGPGAVVYLPTGLKFALPEGIEAQLRPRSGLSTKRLLIIPNSPGTIDPSFRGEWKVCLYNLSNVKTHLAHGDRVAQVVFNKVELPEFEVVEELNDTKRGAGEYGSTGLK